jgi:Family of unknown function (DUF5706)
MDRTQSPGEGPVEVQEEPRQAKVTLDFLWKVRDGVAADIRFADTKAVMVIGFCSAFISGMFAAKLQRFLRGGPALWGAGLYETLMAAGTAAALLLLGGAIIASVWAFIPRLWDRRLPSLGARVKHVFWRLPSSSPGFLYWEHIRAHGGPPDFWKSVAPLTEAELAEKVAEQLFVLSCVATDKYMSLTRSVRMAAPGGLLAAVLLFFEH